jgi:peptidyl-prolyl cis-trans isomerase B (cyclophilin B)
MTRWHRPGTVLVIALAVCALPAARQGNTLQGAFTCGQDQLLPAPIPLLWTTIVLAGDGRLYSPCPGGNHGADHREVREAALIGEGRYSSDGELRWRAAQAQARHSTTPAAFSVPGGGNPPRAGSLEFALAQVDGLGGLIAGLTVIPACYGEARVFDGTTSPLRWQPGRLFFMLGEIRQFVVRGDAPRSAPPDFLHFRRRVAMEGAYAIGAQLSRPGLDANVVTAATRELRACFSLAGDSEVAGLILEDLGVAHYEKENEIQGTENFLIQESFGTGSKILGAVKGLEALIRQHPQHQIGDNARFRLRQLVTYGSRTNEPSALNADARIRRLALMALQAAHDLDDPTLGQAVADRDWQVRRLVAGSLNLSDPQMAAIGEILAADPAFQVRYELLSPLSRLAARTHDCAPIVDRFKDPSPIVVMHAMDVLSATCTDLDEVTKKLTGLADRLGDPADDKDWHINSRALTALVRVKPAEARPRLEAAAKNAVWQVRAAVAAASGVLGDEDTATKLARDPEPNVRTAALDALLRMRSAGVVPQAIDALKDGSDYQLIRMAATVLRGLPDDAKTDASNALLIAMRKLTDQESDTSRDPRLAIVDRLAETLSPGRSNDLLPFATDFDDEVNAAVIKVVTLLVNAPPVAQPPKRRYPYQPPAESLNALPSQAVIQLEGGIVTLSLLKDVAPVTIARFAELVTRGYYNGLTFHRVVPNFIVQGGSSGGNDSMGTTRYMREEVGPQAAHVRGAVGISTRGHGTGDGQIFIDLVDLPRFDREYTVFAYVTQGMELVDKMLEGAKIVSISVK